MFDKVIIRDAVEMLKKHEARPPYVLNLSHGSGENLIVRFDPNTGFKVTDDYGNLILEWCD